MSGVAEVAPIRERRENLPSPPWETIHSVAASPWVRPPAPVKIHPSLRDERKRSDHDDGRRVEKRIATFGLAEVKTVLGRDSGGRKWICQRLNSEG
jgi:hypothetical protein